MDVFFGFLALVLGIYGWCMYRKHKTVKEQHEAAKDVAKMLMEKNDALKQEVSDLKYQARMHHRNENPDTPNVKPYIKTAAGLATGAALAKKAPVAAPVAPKRHVEGGVSSVSSTSSDSGSSTSDMLLGGIAGYALGSAMSHHDSSPSVSPDSGWHTGGGEFSGGGATHDYGSDSGSSSYDSGSSSYDSGSSDCGSCDCG